MPVHIQKKGDEYCVVEPNGSEVKCHPSREEALAHMQAMNLGMLRSKGRKDVPPPKKHAQRIPVGIEAQDGGCWVNVDEFGNITSSFSTYEEAEERLYDEAAPEVNFGATLKDVEIFRTGTWNGDAFSESDLDAMVDAFGKVGYIPPVTLGHVDRPGAPAWGWISSLRRLGDKLVADFKDVPDSLAELIRNHQYKTLSSEIFVNLKRNGGKFAKALKAVAVLGADIPAVSGLKPLSEYFSHEYLAHEESAEKTHFYDLDDPGVSKMSKEADKDTSQDTGLEELQAMVKQLQEEKDALSKKTTQDATEFMKLQQQLNDRDERLTALEQKHRNEEIAKLSEECLIPALRKYLVPLYSSLDEGHTLKFDQKDVLTWDVLKLFVTDINKVFQKIGKDMTRELAHHEGQENEPEYANAGAEVDAKTHEFMLKNNLGREQYQVALHSVLDKDPELKKRYVLGQS